jgi:hypothetical protein
MVIRMQGRFYDNYTVILNFSCYLWLIINNHQGFFLLFLPQNVFLTVFKIWIPNWAPDPKIEEKEDKRNFMFLKDGCFLKLNFEIFVRHYLGLYPHLDCAKNLDIDRGPKHCFFGKKVTFNFRLSYGIVRIYKY